MLTVKDLPESDRTRSTVPHPDGPIIIESAPVFLYCDYCGERSSATRGDYFWMPPDKPFVCECGGPLQLARENCRIEVIELP